MIIELFQRADADLFPPEEQWRLLIIDEVRHNFILEVLTSDMADRLVEQINRAARKGAPWEEHVKPEDGAKKEAEAVK